MAATERPSLAPADPGRDLEGGGRAGRLRRVAARLGLVALFAYLAAAALAMGFADRLIFLPPEASYDDDLDGLLFLTGSGGRRIAARWVPTPGAEVAVLFAHGNAEDIGHGVRHQDGWADLGASVLTFDYPGYGLSSGRPSEEGAYDAADAAYRFLVAQGIDPGTIIVHGRSLGGGVVVDLASRERVGGVIIESSFVSAYRVMTRVPLLPVDQLDNLAKLPRVDAPVLVIHGSRDLVVAPWHGRALFDALPEERRSSLWVEGAGHNDLAAVAGAGYWSALADFAARVARAGGA